MNNTSRLHSKPGSFLGRLLTTGFSLWLLGVAFSPALAATPSPAVDQSPLIIQKPLPPNIVLMLDDSGSMAWDVMPDWNYLSSTSADALVNSDVNGLYFTPTVTYVPPLKADGSSYPDAAFDSALVDGFNSSSTKVDLSTYDGSSDDSRNGQIRSDIAYSVGAGSGGYGASTCSSYDGTSQRYPGYCYASYNNGSSDFSYNGNYYYYRCSSHQDRYNADGKCYPHSFFTYTKRDSSGNYTRYYVAKTVGDCAAASLAATVCDESAVTRQNVANWFSYYHTRILMAKSGVMDAFSSVDAAYRIGFGSINGNNDANLPTPNAVYGSNNNKIAQVVPFDSGAAGTQKASFWKWVAGAKANNSTPLRRSLDAVGQYYQAAQPWQTSASDTTELACRQSYTILTTDGFWNGGTPSSIGNVDNTTKGPITGPNNQPFTYNPALPYSDDQSDTLADVAMKYWVNDLRTGSVNEVPTSKEDPAFWQHMVTFTLGLGFDPVYSAGGATIPVDQVFAWANGDSSQAISGFSWPTPSKDNITNIADLAHAAVNGHGGFASAKTPGEFSDALKKALQRASDRVGTGASLAANSTQLKTGAFAYQANYYTGNWKGDLKAIAVNPNNGTLALTPTWTAAGKLPAASDRKIYTYNPSVASVAAVAFTDPATLASAEQTALGADATAQQNMINYLRGDASLEKPKTGGIYRTRETALGDIVNSQPVYVGQPEANQFVGQAFTGSDSFGSYAATTRQGLIFVSANDGMLHAFNADTGAEVFAYLPAAVITSGLSSLSNPDYGSTSVPHQFFNDGELTVADVYFGSAWHTVAVGTTGRGTAKAIYALDVTDPTNITLLWERSAGDGKSGADSIGQMIGKPVIAQTNVAANDTTGDNNWSVLIGNGYNSKNGTAALLQFAIKDGTLSVHATDSATANGLAAPAVWMGDLSVGISTVAYAGDAQGRVWSFGLNTATTRGNTTTYAATPTSTGSKLYTAMDAATGGTAQPITGGMLVGKNPLTQDLWVFFGTGQYLSSTDLTSTATQSWYGLIVKSATSGLAVDGTKNRGNLMQRSIIAETPGTPEVLNADGTVNTAAIAPARAVTAAPSTSDMAGKSGWYIDLLSPTSSTDSTTGNVTYTPNQTAQGERIVTPNQFQGNQLLATTRIPQATDLCNPSGRGWIMAVDPFTGTNPKSSFFDLNGDGLINQPADYIMVNGVAVATSGMGFNSLPNNPIFMGGSMLVSFDNGSATSIKTSGTSGTLQRVSWRELIAQ
ncbi:MULTISPECIES: pilus assembly protein [Rhodanobacter]|uniref:pilus assembly protein n=1 Tax=Rhodanobacter TaxID=75309 RepID=UPI0003FF812B|nr:MULTISPECIES: PilC/PilY family type IV pilus protein [Rhodanobacter]KZC19786.1 pilus assembly protein PilY [Rhodanobacter denitrificans]UJJ52297.1 pilus assembly protein PilY [Rhodanobacter denitrificans]UJM95043.1 pilus assembly protein PilY [Rhodanobacter denitrificans]UJM98574.1 pilus assembly protein PilY [Rhodanobacter denitrificans]UJN22012.1 pilus assembly protein PilY [Rhodanobacter denitrificans]